MKSDLTDIRKKFQVVRLEESDVRSRTDHFQELRRLILTHEHMYPEIAEWFRGKVTPGIRATERAAFIGYLDDRPVVSAVVKRGAVAKFCHLHIEEGIQNSNLGEVFFSLMANEVRDLAQKVYFTLPESLWCSKGEFFQSFNFTKFQRASEQYRFFDEELECEARFADVWSAVVTKLPKMCSLYAAESLATDLLMSIHPRYVERIFNGTKRFELRRKFSTKWLGHRMNIYATEPAMQLVGHATVRRVIRNTPHELWEKLGPELGCSRADFDQYTRGADEVYAIELDETTPFRVPVSRKDIAGMLKESLVPPQSYCSLDSKKGWGKAVSIAAILQGAFKAQILDRWNTLLAQRKSTEKNGRVSQLQMGRLFS
jgi:predicted transcriptional regulator